MTSKEREVLILEAEDGVEILAGELLGDLRVRAGSPGRVEAAGGDEIQLEEGEAGTVRLQARGDLVLWLPPEARLTLTAVRGDARIQAIRGGLSIDEVSGDLMLRDLGPVEIGSVYGDLSAARVEGDLNVSRVYGDASLREVSGDLRLGSVGADLHLRAPGGRVEAEAGADASVDLTGVLAPELVLRAGADIRLRLDPEAGLSLEASSAAGELRLEMDEGEIPDEALDDGRMQLTLGDGAGRVELSAGGALSVIVGRGEASPSGAQWAEMGEDFRKMAEQFAQRMEEQMSSMSEALGDRLAHLSETLPEVLTAAGLSTDEADRIVVKVRQAGERAGEKAQRKVERAMRRAEQKVARAERQARSARRQGGRGRKQRWIYAPDHGEEGPGREPVSAEERLAVLRLLESGAITADEAERLLAAMEGREVAS